MLLVVVDFHVLVTSAFEAGFPGLVGAGADGPRP